MTDSIIPLPEGGIQAVDSLNANEVVIELEGQRISGIFRVMALVPFKLDVKPSITKMTHDPFRISKMVQRDSSLPFNRWLQDTINAKDDIARPLRALDIVAIDDGTETRRWKIKGAWISEISYSDFDTGSGELVQETVTIQYDTIDTIWSGGA